MKRLLLSKVVVFVLSVSLLVAFFLIRSSYNKEGSNQIEPSLFSSTKINEILKKSYFEGYEKAQFSSANLVYKDLDNYKFYWILALMNQLNYRQSDLPNIKDHYYKLVLKTTNFESLDELRQLSDIIKFLKVQDEKTKNLILEKVMQHYDNQEKLFFNLGQNESLREKLVATSKVIEILKDVSPFSNFLNETKVKLIRLLDSEIFFTNSNIKENVLNNEGLLISSLNSLGVNCKNTKLNNLNKMLIWLNKINEKSLELKSMDAYTLSVANSIIDINGFFVKTYSVSEKMTDQINKDKFILQNSSFSNDGYVYEPQYIYLLSKLSNESNIATTLSKIKEYIDKSIEEGFTVTLDPKINIQDMYYGLFFANSIKFNYNEKKIKSLLSEYKISLMNDLSDFDKNKMIKLLYLLKCYSILDIPFQGKTEIYNKVNEQLLNLNSKDKSIIFEIRSGLELLKEMGMIPNENVKTHLNKVILELQEKNLVLDNFDYSINLYFVILNLGLEKEYKDEIDKIVGYLLELKEDGGGFKQKKTEGGVADIITTSEALTVLYKSGQLSELIKNSNLEFLKSLREEDGIFNISKVNKNTDLRVLYHVYQVEKLIINN
ncbi:hypothetical protein [Paenibacillus sp. J22TS3]|uniref:prenyltransferase/squalene oxidase repeat-containing protein n=1 Tax=Paenibacillus sp. J22TS3 TaxID=2807192 RepID=UPI001B03A150|nr:hypothetical protein [Paenibacillus sp. J22TS3]GIP22584.1 hypothetical protein J22TS3_28590 [Paenibacillus sp. J22TS3]